MVDFQPKIIDESQQGAVFSSSLAEVKSFAKHFYIESYGCQMNFSDSEIVASILQQDGFGATKNIDQADLIFINTCSIREKAEQTVRHRLQSFKKIKQQRPGLLVGVLGCMAERLKGKFLEEEQLVDIVVGPDAYRSLPQLVQEATSGQKSINVLLSREETYADIAPVRLDENGVSAFVSIMRGCNNMCTFCVVPFTRGRERSRDAASIIKECKQLFADGYREVTLLGQNVDSYYFTAHTQVGTFTETNFAQLLDQVAAISPLLRVRFSTSHPKDITDEVLHVMASKENICKYIHLPVQSGNTRVLSLMNRTYTREWYLNKVKRIREIMPDCGLSTDIISGFCTETEQEHQDTISLMELCKFDMAYMFSYSERPGTLAARRYEDDVTDADKKRRLQEIIEVQNRHSRESYLKEVGTIQQVLIEGDSKRSASDWCGRSSQNKMVVFPKGEESLEKGMLVLVEITSATQATLKGTVLQAELQQA